MREREREKERKRETETETERERKKERILPPLAAGRQLIKNTLRTPQELIPKWEWRSSLRKY